MRELTAGSAARVIGTFLVGIAIAIAAAPVGAASQQRAAEGRPVLTVVGQGRDSVPPDMAVIRFGVAHEAPVPEAAMARVSGALAALRERIAASGVAPDDVQTGSLTLTPLWERAPESDARRKIGGYLADSRLRVRLRDPALVGPLLEAGLEAGANRLDGLSFALQDPGASEGRALRRAVEDAMRKARILAAAAGVSLGEILSISETVALRGGPVMARGLAPAEAVPVAPGEIETGATVTIVFAIARQGSADGKR